MVGGRRIQSAVGGTQIRNVEEEEDQTDEGEGEAEAERLDNGEVGVEVDDQRWHLRDRGRNICPQAREWQKNRRWQDIGGQGKRDDDEVGCRLWVQLVDFSSGYT